MLLVRYWEYCLLLFLAGGAVAGEFTLSDMKALPIDELSSLEIGIASKFPTRVQETPAAVFVLTAEDIRRSGADNLPDALRLVPGMNVAAVSGNTWAVNSRGFHEIFSNKFLVLLDGRSLYDHTFGGVYWDAQSIHMGDIARIEVIRGPGGAVWGSNAMNGVINIITRSSVETQGGEVSTLMGNQLREGYFRYGAELDQNTAYRVSGRVRWQAANKPSENSGMRFWEPFAADDSDHFRLGMRVDKVLTSDSMLMLDSGAYKGESNQRMVLSQHNSTAPDFNTYTAPLIAQLKAQGWTYPQLIRLLILPEQGLCTYCITNTQVPEQYEGGYLLGRWRQATENDWQKMQGYLDISRRTSNLLNQRSVVADIDWERGWQQDNRRFAVGAGLRSVKDYYSGIGAGFFFSPASQRNNTLNVFAQSGWQVSPQLDLTAGLSYEYSSQLGDQWQPSLRLLWSPAQNTHMWGLVSRSYRTPTRLEVSGNLNTYYHIMGKPDHPKETLSALELGWRQRFGADFCLDVAGFYYRYEDLNALRVQRLFDPTRNQMGQLEFTSVSGSDAYGAEASFKWQVNPSWRLRASVSYLEQKSDSRPEGVEPTIIERGPSHQFTLHSGWDLSENVELDLNLYYVSALGESGSSLLLFADQAIDSYWRTDLRLGWQLSPSVQLELIGKNLLDGQHSEFFSSPANVGALLENTEIERSLAAKLTVRF